MKYILALVLTTTFIMNAQENESHYEWSILFMEFLPVAIPQDLSPSPIFDNGTPAARQKALDEAQQALCEMEKRQQRLQAVADDARLSVEQQRAQIEKMKKSNL